MVELPDSVLTAMLFGIPLVLTFVYFQITRKDKSKVDNATGARDEEENERDKQELARKVKKELMDEAEKVETIRKAVAVDVKEATQIEVDQKIREQRTDYEHKLEMYKQGTESKFSAMDKVNDGLMSKMVETTKTQADALRMINQTIESLRTSLYEVRGKVNKVEQEQKEDL